MCFSNTITMGITYYLIKVLFMYISKLHIDIISTEMSYFSKSNISLWEKINIHY